MAVSSDKRLGTEPLGKLIFKLALPGIAAQLINVLYNMVDRMYIGHIPEVGATALTGLGVCLPIIVLISAFSAFAGMGGAPLAAIQLGKGNKAQAEKILGNATTMLLVCSVILTTVFMIFKEPILYAFGASDETIVYALDYVNIYLVGTIFVQFALGLNTYISCQGNAKTAMLSVLIGAVLNIILDPIFIFAMDMGVKGAALATIISQAVSAVWVVSFLVSKRSVIRIKKENLKPEWKVVGMICALGVSPFVMQSTEALVTIILNSGLQEYGGDLYVGSLTILQSVMQLTIVPVNGMTQGVQPVISYNYGAGNFDRVKKTFKIVLIADLCVTVVACLLTQFIPGVFASVFTTEVALIELVEQVMPIFFAGIWIFGVQMACQSTFMGMGQAKVSLFLALLRKVILLIPLALILPKFFDVQGIYYAEPVADIVAAVTTGIVFMTMIKKLLKKEEQTITKEEA